MPSLHSPKIEVLIVDDEVQARELLSEFCGPRVARWPWPMTAGWPLLGCGICALHPFSAAIPILFFEHHLLDRRSVQRVACNRRRS